MGIDSDLARRITLTEAYLAYGELIHSHAHFVSEMSKQRVIVPSDYSFGLRIFADVFKSLGEKYDLPGFKVLTRDMASSIEEEARFWR